MEGKGKDGVGGRQRGEKILFLHLQNKYNSQTSEYIELVLDIELYPPFPSRGRMVRTWTMAIDHIYICKNWKLKFSSM